MDYYLDITLKPDPEMPVNQLLNMIYTKFHKALYDMNSKTIGVSFPHYRVMLGDMIRFHGSEADLNRLQQLNWIGGMTGYSTIGEIMPVPSISKYRTVSRKQTTMSQSKLNRLLRRGSITEEEVKNYRAKMFSKGLDNPYIELISGSNGHRHRRYIEFGELVDKPVKGLFDQFGLSKTATVPWF